MYKTDKSLNYLGFKMVRPPQELQAWVQCFWSIDANLKQVHQEVLYPDGCNSLIVNSEASGWFLDSAPMRRDLHTFQGKVNMSGVRFWPGMLSSILQKPAKFICVQEGAFSGVEKCSDVFSLETFIHEMIWNHKKEAKNAEILQDAFQSIASNLGDLRMSHLARELGTYSRHTERIFQSAVGVGPKMIQNMLRIREARHRIKDQPSQLLAPLALELGFFDQSHFSRFFKRFTGISPKKYALRVLARST